MVRYRDPKNPTKMETERKRDTHRKKLQKNAYTKMVTKTDRETYTQK